MAPEVFYRRIDWPPPIIGKAAAEEEVRRQVPVLIAQVCGQTPLDLQPQAMTTYHYVYRVILKDNECFLKIPKFADSVQGLHLEHYVYTQVLQQENFGLQVLAFDESRRFGPFAFLLLGKAPGVCLRGIGFDGNFANIIRDLGAKASRCHSLGQALKGFGPLRMEGADGAPAGTFDRWPDYVLCKHEQHISDALACGLLDKADTPQVDAAMAFLATQVDDIRQGALLHGDLGSHNIFVDQAAGKVSAIIDWEDACLGDPVFDIAMFASFFRMHEFLKDFVSGYGRCTVEDHQFMRRLWSYYLRIVIAKGLWGLRTGQEKSAQFKSADKVRLALRQLRQYT